MNLQILIIGLYILFFSQLYGQNMRPPHMQDERREKIDQLEKIKLLEILNLDEEKMLKFFNRYNKHKDQFHALVIKKDSIIYLMEKMLKNNQEYSDKEFQEILDSFLSADEALFIKRSDFVGSIDNLLTPEQVTKFLIFQSRFQREIQEIMMKKKFRQGPPPKN